MYDRQQDAEAGATQSRALVSDGATMALHDVFAQPEAQPHAGGLAAGKNFKQRVLYFVRYSRAIVGNSDFLLCASLGCLKQEPGLTGRARLKSLQAVEKQVHQHLMEFVFRDLNVDPFDQLQFKLDLPSFNFLAEQLQRLSDQ